VASAHFLTKIFDPTSERITTGTSFSSGTCSISTYSSMSIRTDGGIAGRTLSKFWFDVVSKVITTLCVPSVDVYS